jgi:hypothetical protein
MNKSSELSMINLNNAFQTKIFFSLSTKYVRLRKINLLKSLTFRIDWTKY